MRTYVPSFIVDSVCRAPEGVSWPWDVWSSVHGLPDAAGVFGAGSTLAGGGETVQMAEQATQVPTPFYSAAVLVCFVSWMLVLWGYRDYIWGMFNIVRGGVFAEKLLDKHNKLFSACLDWSIGLGGFALGLVCARMSGVDGAGGAVGMWAGAAGVWGAQWLVLVMAGRLTMYVEFTARLFYLRKILAAAGSVLLLPLFFLYALSASRAIGLLLLAGSGVLMIFLIIRTFMLFMRQKFSILLWFLYLCAVEILPINAILIAARKLL